METEILGGIQMGYRTILTLTGSTKMEDLAKYPYQPDRIVASIVDLNQSGASFTSRLPSGDVKDDTVILSGDVDAVSWNQLAGS